MPADGRRPDLLAELFSQEEVTAALYRVTGDLAASREEAKQMFLEQGPGMIHIAVIDALAELSPDAARRATLFRERSALISGPRRARP
jgi:hypothetical protein